MLKANRKGSVFIQGWFVFLLFVSIVNQAVINRYYYDQAKYSLIEAKEVIEAHNQIIEQCRTLTQTCDKKDEMCFIQQTQSKRFNYLIKFDPETLHVIEILITNH
jgi:hypothetical protein